MATPKEVLVWIGRNGRRLAVSVLGFILILGGLAGLALPLLPGWLLIIAGLAVLATEYTWAERALDSAKRRARAAASKARQKMKRSSRQSPRD